MKINRLDAHDRLQHFTKQSFDIGECCQNLIDQRPYGDHNFYIFAHSRTDDDGVTKRLIWQPRLTKPKAQTNSMLFKAYPGQDIIKVIWMIPAPEMWDQYTKGLLCENQTVTESIFDYTFNKGKLEAAEEDDLSEYEVNMVYLEISRNAQKVKNESVDKDLQKIGMSM